MIYLCLNREKWYNFVSKKSKVAISKWGQKLYFILSVNKQIIHKVYLLCMFTMTCCLTLWPLLQLFTFCPKGINKDSNVTYHKRLSEWFSFWVWFKKNFSSAVPTQVYISTKFNLIYLVLSTLMNDYVTLIM